MGAIFLVVAGIALLSPFVNKDESGPVAFVRTFYPQLLLVLFFGESIRLSVVVTHGVIFDDAIAAIDNALFGFQPARRFHQNLVAFPAINELMFGSYFLYYVIFTLTPWIAWLKGNREMAGREMFVYVAMMAILFSWYIFFRVEGPKYWFPDLRAEHYGQFSGGLFVVFFQDLFRNAQLYGAAFPSTHVAFALLMTIFAWRTVPRLLWFYVPAFILISASTVYIYAHYFADIIGGIVVTLILEPPLWRAYPAVRDRVGRWGRNA